ncbi:MAG TPA: zinc ribbon domain-containing protein, partial [Steroidobacteraceae bacterium]|nr:zinc ribbon domain-containing protein [Steroidobacteraceae bacterium]
MILTYRYRLKATSGAAQELSRQARAVNLVWNFCGETQETARRWDRIWPSGFDLISLTYGSSRELRLHSDTVQAVYKEFAHSRDTHRRRVLDASWSQLRSQLRDKAMRHGAEYFEVDERFTTQVCSGCGALGGPQGREGLVV